MATADKSNAWIRALAAPYLRGYRARAATSGGLRGYWFAAPTRGAGSRAGEAGFFVGYLFDAEALPYLSPQPPECLVFAWVRPPGGALHRRLTCVPDGLLRRIFEYIRWLTHRLPRFQFFEREAAALVRHRPMADWPADKREHYSRNYFIETLAWLVRSGLVRKLAEEAAVPPSAARRRPRKKTPKKPRSARPRP